MKGILGRKLGMTQVFTSEGNLIPVTVVECEPNVVVQKKTQESDGYEALQLGLEDVKESRTTKALVNHAKKANTAPKRFLREVKADELMNLNVGDLVKVDIFSAGDIVDVTGTSKGKGYMGTIVRNNAHQGPRSHGGSKNIRHSLYSVKSRRTFLNKINQLIGNFMIHHKSSSYMIVVVCIEVRFPDWKNLTPIRTYENIIFFVRSQA